MKRTLTLLAVLSTTILFAQPFKTISSQDEIAVNEVIAIDSYEAIVVEKASNLSEESTASELKKRSPDKSVTAKAKKVLPNVRSAAGKANNAPYLVNWSPEAGNICPGNTFVPIGTITLGDAEGDAIIITGIVSDDEGKMTSASLIAEPGAINGNEYSFSISGDPLSPGSVNLSVTFDDGINGPQITNVAFTVTTPYLVPTFASIDTDICEGETPSVLTQNSDEAFWGTWNPSTIDNYAVGITTYTYTPDPYDCTVQTTVDITVNAYTTPSFSTTQNYCNGDTPDPLPTESIESILGSWTPASINTTVAANTVDMYQFNPDGGIGCYNSFDLYVTVGTTDQPSFSSDVETCVSESIWLNSTSDNNVSGSWTPSNMVSEGIAGTYTYTFTPDDQTCTGTVDRIFTVYDYVTPTFDPISFCVGDMEATLPDYSNEGVSVSWSPGLDVSVSGVYWYNYYVDEGATSMPDMCAYSGGELVTIMGEPTFDPLGFCEDEVGATLSATSSNGYTGTWSPSDLVDTDLPGTFNYSYTVSHDCISGTFEFEVVILPALPSFPTLSYCFGDVEAQQPLYSEEGYTGSWYPADLDDQTLGVTNYTFTPDGGQCGTIPVEVPISIEPLVTPTFDPIGPFCQYDTPIALPNTSNEGITGHWEADFGEGEQVLAFGVGETDIYVYTDEPGMYNYTFYPDWEFCTNGPVALEVTILSATPNFSDLSFCEGESPFDLATISDEGYTGTWSPSATVNTALPGTVSYTFTPDPAQCATTDEPFDVTVQPLAASFSDLIYCVGEYPQLPSSSDEGYYGYWTPGIFSTDVAGITNYTFNPDPGQCSTDPQAFDVEVKDYIIIDIDPLGGPYCQGDVVPTLSTIDNNGVTGTWSPSVIDNLTPGTNSYTFTPDATYCIYSYHVDNVTIMPSVPAFEDLTFCVAESPSDLPTTSKEGYTGVWSPATAANTATAGTFTFTFTPDAAQCATDPQEYEIFVTDPEVPTFLTQDTLLCVGDGSNLPYYTDQGFTGTYDPATIATDTPGEFPVLYTPDPEYCATTTVVTIRVDAYVATNIDTLNPMCVGEIINLPPTMPDGSAVYWYINYGLNYTLTGDYPKTVNVILSPYGGCYSGHQIDVTVNPKPDAPGISPSGPTAFCDGSSVDLTASPVYAHTWLPGLETAQTITVSTTETIGLFAISEDGCHSDTVSQMVTSIPLPVIANGTVSDPTTCSGTDGSFEITGTATGNVFWSGDASGNAFGVTLPYTITGLGQGTYTVSFADTSGCLSNTLSATLSDPAAPTPTIIPDGSTTFCEGGSVILMADQVYDSYSWSTSETTATITATVAGSYTLTVTDANGCTGTSSAEMVTLNPKPATPTIVPNPYLTFCQGDFVTLQGASSPPFNWLPNGETSADIVVTTAGTYSFFTKSAEGCNSDTASAVVTVNPLPTPTITPSGATTFCSGGSVDLTASAGSTFLWSPGGETTQTITATAAGSYSVTVTDANGCSGTSVSETVTVNPNPTPSVTPSGSTTFCSGGSVDFTSSAAVSYLWWPGNQTTQTITATTTGSYSVTVTDANGCSGTSAMQDVTVNSNPSASVTPSGATTFCSGGSVDLTASAGTAYLWSPGGQTTQTITATTTGSYSVAITNASGCSSTSSSTTVTVNANMTPTFAATGPYCQGATPGTLATTSTNSITGTWNPATISTASVGTAVYTFTPTAGQCAVSTTKSVVTNTNVTPTFAAAGPYCQGATPGTLATTSTNSITGSWNPATISTATVGTAVYTFTPTAGQCAVSTTKSVVTNTNVTPTFAAAGPYCQGATPGTLATTSTNSITGTWNPATISTATVGTAVYTFTPTAGQCAVSTTKSVVTNTNVTPTFAATGPYCQGATPGTLATTSTNSITGSWNPATISTATVGTAVYTFTPTAGQCAVSTTKSVVTNTNVSPTFAAAGPYCQGATPGTLATTSTNSITGTWNPATISTASVGTAVYTFTPTAGQCAVSTTKSVVTNTNVTPTFAAAGPYCQGATPGTLATTSTNSITGTWNPATISTASVGTAVYTFTPTAGQCAVSTTKSVVTNTNVTPTFAAAGPYCQGATPGTLATTSTNSITGTWNPATISTASVGTAVYTFTPTAGQCAVSTTKSVVTNTNVTPTFAATGPYCQGATPGTLATTSTNSITGSWNPATISTATVGTAVYTFTPTAGQCAVSTTKSVVTKTNVTPTFAVAGPYCQDATPGTLATTSTNSITGTWNPATISTASVGTAVYTFTPTAGQCAVSTTKSVVTNTNVTPTFAVAGPYCQSATPGTLATTSTNSITGTWNPATISTASVGTAVYTFTPTAGQCAVSTTKSVVTKTNVTPTFAATGPYCQGATPGTLATTSTNSITGTWNPATISTATVGTAVYTFTPTAGQCAVSTTKSVVTNTNVTPTFAAAGPYCQGATPGTLATTSTNSITGTWNPATISTASVGTAVYTFTPTAGQCAVSATKSVVTNTNVTPTFAAAGPYCQGATPGTLATTSTNSITGTWNPATISTASVGTAVYTFTPTAGQCAVSATKSVVTNTNVTPVFGGVGPYCKNEVPNSLPANSVNSISGTWSPSTINTSTVGVIAYTFTPIAGQCAVPTTINIVTNAPSASTFAAVGPYCQNDAAPALNSTSIEGISGSWSPASVSTLSPGATVYTFTPTAGLCASTAALNIVVNAPATPGFSAVTTTYCQDTPAGTLPSVSDNGISGSWSPSVISTSTVGTSAYVFTANAGQCAVNSTLSVSITAPSVAPDFSSVATTYCQDTPAGALPSVSDNSISGSWSPSVISTSTVGTSAYIFTANAGQCAVNSTLSVSITAPSVAPDFSSVTTTYCQDMPAGTLPSVSDNGISGSWSPSVISTSTIGSVTYAFTPVMGQCATIATLSVTTTAPAMTPDFGSFAVSYCQGTGSQSLPPIADNGVTGTWSPSFISTVTVGSATYTFTPTAGQCAAVTTLDIAVTNNMQPTFDPVAVSCLGATGPALPTVSANGISGSWSPSTVITAAVGTFTYTFTPGVGQCGSATTMAVTVANPVSPDFSAIGPLCLGASVPVLPTASPNGVIGSWSPAVLSSAALGNSTYSFTPDAGQCASSVSMDVEVKQFITPEFASIAPLCEGDVAPALPSTSNNGVTGTWSPAVISSSAAGITSYSFTPDASTCGVDLSMEISVHAPVLPVFTQSSLTMCTHEGMVNLDDFVSVAGGKFGVLGQPGVISGSFDTDNSPIAPGTHTLIYTVTNGACVNTAQATLNFYQGPSVTISANPTQCGLQNGSALANIVGGSTPYNLLQWSSGEQGVASVSDLASGQYTFTIVDNNDCMVTNFFDIGSSGVTISGVATDATCNGTPDGAIDVTTVNMQAPISVLWSSGHHTLDLTDMPAGNYTVSVTDANGCTLNESFTIGQPELLTTTVTITEPDCQQSNGVMQVNLTSGGTAPYTYAWSNGDNGLISSNNGGGVYSLTTTDDAGCMAIKPVQLSELNAAGLTGTVSPAECGSPVGAIDVTPVMPAGTTVESISWSNGAITEDIHDLTSGSFTCTFVTSNGCTAVKTWNIPVVAPEKNDICVVTVDSATTTNLVVWEKVQPVGIAYYNIYRETSVQGDYQLIDTVEATNISLFNDVVASPLVRSWRYRISAVNACNVEGPLSVPHQTIHLDVLKSSATTVDINWNAYEGAIFDSYVVSRYTDATGWEDIAVLPIDQFSYTDAIDFETEGLDYMVEMQLSEQCTALIWRAQDFNSARSNKDKGQFAAGEGTGDSNNGIDEAYLSSVEVYPNPTMNILYISQEKHQELNIEVRSVEGQLIRTLKTSELTETVDLGDLATGVYFIRLRMNGTETTVRVVKQ